MSDAKQYRHNKQATPRAKGQASTLRKELTPPERLLWSALRGKGINGLRFRRQAPLGPYIADFYCHDARLVLEIDGGSHSGDQLEHDRKRDQWMKEQGIRMFRVQARDVFGNLESVTRTIAREAGNT